MAEARLASSDTDSAILTIFTSVSPSECPAPPLSPQVTSTFDSCSFSANLADTGAGLFLNGSRSVTTVTNSAFYLNNADTGAVATVSGSHALSLRSCNITANKAFGGAVFHAETINPALNLTQLISASQLTLSGNTAAAGWFLFLHEAHSNLPQCTDCNVSRTNAATSGPYPIGTVPSTYTVVAPTGVKSGGYLQLRRVRAVGSFIGACLEHSHFRPTVFPTKPPLPQPRCPFLSLSPLSHFRHVRLSVCVRRVQMYDLFGNHVQGWDDISVTAKSTRDLETVVDNVTVIKGVESVTGSFNNRTYVRKSLPACLHACLPGRLVSCMALQLLLTLTLRARFSGL